MILVNAAIIFWWHACQPQQPDPKSLLYAPLPNVIFDTGQTNDTNQAIANAFEAYEKEDYVQAQELFEGLPPDQKTPDIQFYLGMSRFAQGKYADARGPIKRGGQFGSRFGEAALYYLVIADYELGRKVPAFERLQSLLYRDRLGTFTSKANQLLALMAQDPEIPENRER